MGSNFRVARRELKMRDIFIIFCAATKTSMSALRTAFINGERTSKAGLEKMGTMASSFLADRWSCGAQPSCSAKSISVLIKRNPRSAVDLPGDPMWIIDEC